MPHDPARIAEVCGWLGRASEDLRGATHELTAAPPILGDLVFHCQQAVEKTFKGLLAWHDRTFRRTHSLEELGEQCLRVDESLRPVVDQAVPLTEYAWRFRYPGEPEQPGLGEALEALEIAHGQRSRKSSIVCPLRSGHEVRPGDRASSEMPARGRTDSSWRGL